MERSWQRSVQNHILARDPQPYWRICHDFKRQAVGKYSNMPPSSGWVKVIHKQYRTVPMLLKLQYVRHWTWRPVAKTVLWLVVTFIQNLAFKEKEVVSKQKYCIETPWSGIWTPVRLLKCVGIPRVPNISWSGSLWNVSTHFVWYFLKLQWTISRKD